MIAHLSTAKTQQFIKDYRLPITATLVFLVMLLSILMVRIYERSALADVLPGKNDSGQDYAALLSSDKADEFKKNDITPEEQAKQEEAKKTESSIASNFTVSPGGDSAPSTTTPPADQGNGGGGTTTPPPTVPPAPSQPFSSEVVNLGLDSTSGPFRCGSGLLSTENCKSYTFKGTIRVLGGPGNVTYGWHYVAPGAPPNQEPPINFYVSGSGETLLQRTKVITLSCNNQGVLNVNLYTSSPSQSNKPFSIPHNC